MGNIISQQQYIKSEILRAYVNDWAINNYNGGMDDVANPQTYKKLLKKRACCINQSSIPLSFPTTKMNNLNEIVGIETSTNTITPVQITIFNSSSDINQQNCTFDTGNYYLKLGESGGFIPTGECKILYKGINENNGFCNRVKKDRQRVYSNKLQVAYGPYTINQDGLNTNRDCNCENSILRDVSLEENISNNSGTPIDDEVIVQNFDKRCTLLGNNVYKFTNAKTSNLCVNITNIENSDISGTLDAKSSCANSSNNPQSDNASPISLPSILTPNVMIISGGVAFLIVFLILIKLFI